MRNYNLIQKVEKNLDSEILIVCSQWEYTATKEHVYYD